MSKPDWKDAPERANYLAQDLDGRWYWFELEPYAYAGKLWATYGASWEAPVKNENWQQSLERRP